jgi:hypothetical protein
VRLSTCFLDTTMLMRGHCRFSRSITVTNTSRVAKQDATQDSVTQVLDALAVPASAMRQAHEDPCDAVQAALAAQICLWKFARDFENMIAEQLRWCTSASCERYDYHAAHVCQLFSIHPANMNPSNDHHTGSMLTCCFQAVMFHVHDVMHTQTNARIHFLSHKYGA